MRLISTQSIAVIVVALALVAASCGSDANPANESAGDVADPTPAAATPTPPLREPETEQEPERTEPEPTDELPLAEVLDGLEDRGFNGVVLVETPSDALVRGFGHADREEGISIDGDTVFDTGSLTKQFTGAAVLRLEMDGLLLVEAPVGNYLTGLDPAVGELTLHQLLTHTAGLPPVLGFDYDAVSLEEFVELVNAAADDGLSTGVYDYSNVGYSLLAAVIEAVSGTSYDQYLHDALFAPADMMSTGYQLPDWNQRVVAVGYSGDARWGQPNEQLWADDGPYWHLRGNGGILSSAEDMLRWHQALVGDTILDATAKEKLYARHTEEGEGAGSYYGYGWVSSPTGDDSWLVAHNGGNGIFFADFLRFLDQDVTIFIATNAARSELDDVAYEIAAAVLGDPDLAPPPACGVDTPPLEELVEVDRFADTEAGAVATAWFELLASGDEQARLDFAESSVHPSLGRGATAAQLADAIAGVQDELADTEVMRRLTDADQRFHVIMRTPGGDLVSVSAEMAPEDPTLVRCISIDN